MIIGITGGLATGTSTAARSLAYYLKAHYMDADKLAHSVLKRGNPVCRKIISKFGKKILSRTGSIDRKRLASEVFNNRSKLKALCAIIHPAVIPDIEKRIKRIRQKNRSAFIVIDAPVLIESNFYKKCDIVGVVTSSLALQLERAGNVKNIKTEDALSRIKLQMPLWVKVRYADFIIDNSGSLKELKQKCRVIAKRLKS